MNFFDKFSVYACEKKQVSVGRIVFKTVAITTAVLAFVPTVIVRHKGKGFDAYGLLSHVKYEKSIGEDGKPHHNIMATLIDVTRYGVGTGDKEKTKEINENNEDSSCIQE